MELGQLYNIAEKTNREFFISNAKIAKIRENSVLFGKIVELKLTEPHYFAEDLNYGLSRQFCGKRKNIYIFDILENIFLVALVIKLEIRKLRNLKNSFMFTQNTRLG